MKHTAKSLASFTLALILLLALLPGSVFAAGDTMADATRAVFDRTYNGEITSSSTKDFYYFILPSSGYVVFSATAQMQYIRYILYDVDGNQMWSYDYTWNSVTEKSTANIGTDLTKGTYYLCVKQKTTTNNGVSTDTYLRTGNYSFSLSFTSAQESFTETGNGVNNKLANANAVTIGRNYSGQIAENDTKDFYSINLSSSGYVVFSAIAQMQYIRYILYDVDGNQMWSYDYTWNSTTGKSTANIGTDLTKGTYYLCVKQKTTTDNGVSTDTYLRTGNYSFSLSFTSAQESFTETGNGINNKLANANAVSVNRTYRGQIAENDTKDFYTFALTEKDKIAFTATAGMQYIRYIIYDVDGKSLWNKDYTWNSTTKESNASCSLELDAGTYYLCVMQKTTTDNGVSTDTYLRTGNYSFSLTDSTPGAIATVTATASAGKTSVSWTTSENATAYIIQRRVKDGDTWTTLKSNVTGLSYEDTTGVAGTVYQYRVRGRNGTKYGPFKVSSVVRALAGAPTPGAIATVTATAAAGKTTVTWSASSGATAYIIQRRVKDSTTWTTLKSNVTGRSYVDTTGKAGTVYQYRVRGRDGTSYGPFKVSSVVRSLAA